MPEATLMRGLEERVTTLDGRRARYFVGGDGPPLVLLHGLGGAALNWTLLAPLLARRHRVLVPDLPGHGRSGTAFPAEDLRSFADFVYAVAEREDALPAALVGHSLGGVVALRLAVERADLVRAVVLVETAGIVSTLRRAEIALAFAGVIRPGKQLALVRHPVASRPRLRRLAFALWATPDPRGLSREAVLGFLEGASDARDVAVAARALAREDPRRWLDRIACPALVVWGARDRIVPIEDGFEFARRLRAPIRTIPDAGHLLIGERPAECAAVIDEFLETRS